MNKKAIIGIVIIMSISLLGLMFLQVYWISNAISLKEQEFNTKVNEAISEVVREHEQTIIASVVRPMVKTIEKEGKKYLVINRDTIEIPGSRHRNVEFYFDDKDWSFIWEPSHQYELGTGRIPRRVFQPNPIRPSNPAEFRWMTMVLENIAGELSHFRLNTSNHVNIPLLDSLLRQNLKLRGIDLTYNFAVFSNSADTVFLMDPALLKHEIISTEYKASLFPNQILSKPTLLYVNFPHKFNYLLKSLWVRLITSVVFIIIIIFCFYFTVWTIFRQKKLSDMKNDFINNMTHEFKTPITTISLAGQALSDPSIGTDNRRVFKYSNMIVDESNKLGNNVEKILQMAILDKGNFQLNYSPVNIHDILKELTSQACFRLDDKCDHINLQLEADDPVVKGDSTHIYNIFNNLLDNAIKYAKDEGPQVLIHTKNKKNGVLITISDQGIGMKKESVNRIFEKFFREPTGNVHNVKGFGLGLSYVKTMVDAHLGTINVQSELGKGSTFAIYLPYNYK